jgi:hypothetical protein
MPLSSKNEPRDSTVLRFLSTEVRIMVARWYIFIPKVPIWVYFRGPWNEKYWYFMVFRYILRPMSKFYSYLVYFVVYFWYISSRFGML